MSQTARPAGAEDVPLPVVDLAPFREGDEAARRATADAIDRACRDHGFFYLAGHGVPAPLIERAFAEARRFFALPIERKAAIAIEHSPCHRGWFAVGGENLDVRRQRDGDLKEGVKIGRDLGPDHPRVRDGTPLHGPNQWPDHLPGWRETWLEYYAALEGLGRQLMSAFAVALRLAPDFFEDRLRLPMCTAGPLHYPPHAGPVSEAQLGAGAHTDFGCLTLLAQDDTPGLEVRRRDGGWLPAPPLPGSFVVNVGDMLERWSNDSYRSTVHRVINRTGSDRYSIPFFFDPDFDADISALPGCVPPGETPRYPPTTGGRHLLERIDETFAYHAARRDGAG